MNLVSLYGRIANDSELHYTSTGKAVLSFSMAIRGYNDRTDFIRCQAWEKRAENIANYFHKGSRIAITGRLVSAKYDKDGQTHYTQDVVVDSFDFVDSKQESQQSNHSGNAVDATANRANSGMSNTQNRSQQRANSGEQIDIGDDDLPF